MRECPEGIGGAVMGDVNDPAKNDGIKKVVEIEIGTIWKGANKVRRKEVLEGLAGA